MNPYSVNVLQFFCRSAEILLAIFGNRATVLDSNTEFAFDIDPRFDSDCHAGLQYRIAVCRCTGRLVNQKPETVSKRMSEAFAVSLFPDIIPGNRIQLFSGDSGS